MTELRTSKKQTIAVTERERESDRVLVCGDELTMMLLDNLDVRRRVGDRFSREKADSTPSSSTSSQKWKVVYDEAMAKC